MLKTIKLNQLDSLEDPLIIDVRTPSEFQEDHHRNAINLPVLNDEQREEVGTIHNLDTTFEARQIGARYISENLPGILERVEEKYYSDRAIVVYCWRGGMRSESLGLVLDRIGYPTYRIEGGYRSLRKNIKNYLESGNWPHPVVTLYGYTGTGKTEILHNLANRGESIIDLEDLANHRGSAFGGVGLGEQPSQKWFEHRLYEQLDQSSAPLFLEGESRQIGRCHVPDRLYEDLANSPRIWVEANLEYRINNIMDEYEWPREKDQLIQNLEHISERFGSDKTSHLQDLLRKDRVESVVETLLTDYYDPAYDHSCPDRSEFDLIINGDNPEQSIRQILQWKNNQLSITTAQQSRET
ncbi:MAG: tRNA 2-selenouridine(34) synthase MnmH [bacterium]